MIDHAIMGMQINGSHNNHNVTVNSAAYFFIMWSIVFNLDKQAPLGYWDDTHLRLANTARLVLRTLHSRARVCSITPTDRQGLRKVRSVNIPWPVESTDTRTQNSARSTEAVVTLICIRLVKGRSQRVLIAQILHVSPPHRRIVAAAAFTCSKKSFVFLASIYRRL